MIIASHHMLGVSLTRLISHTDGRGAKTADLASKLPRHIVDPDGEEHHLASAARQGDHHVIWIHHNGGHPLRGHRHHLLKLTQQEKGLTAVM